MTPEEKIEELYERIWFYKDKLITYDNVLELARKQLMKSNIPIEEGAYLMSTLNYIEDKCCSNESYFLPKEYTNQDLKRVLEMI